MAQSKMHSSCTVDLLIMKCFLLLLVISGCCLGQDLLPEGPVVAVFRKNVTFKTLVNLSDDFITFVWFFNRGSVLVPIVTLTPTGITVAEGYQGRVQVNRTNGFLTMGPLTASDRGYYNATMVTSEMIKSGETMLRVQGCCDWYALPEGPVEAVSGQNVTFKTLIDPREKINATNWFFYYGREQRRVVTMSKPQESYQGRVTVNQTNGFLTLGPLSMADSGDYHVNIFTDKGVKTGETTLRVLEPVLHVTIRANVSDTVDLNSTVVLTCSAKGSFLKFSWTSGTTPIVANNTRLTIDEDATSSVLTISGIRSSDLAGPIYCTAANQLQMEKSAPFNLTVTYPPHPSVLTQPGLVSTVHSVTFENPDPCALKGSSVQFRCSYDYPDGETVHKTEWFKGKVSKDGIWRRIELSSLLSYQNRVKYLGDHDHNCSLKIYDLQDDDARYYYFRFDTNAYGYRSKRSVYLSLTGLTASVEPNRVRNGQHVTLTCHTSCKLPGPTTTVWFRNGQAVAKPPQFQAVAEDAGSYTCAVKGLESVQSDPVLLDVQYAPVNVIIELSHNGSLVMGSSVTLTCSSVANPAADSHTWYRRTGSSSLIQVGSRQVLSLPSLELSNAGLYICQAKNNLGENNSTEVLLKVDIPEIPTGLPAVEEQEEGSGRIAMSSYVVTSSHIITPPDTILPTHTTMSPDTTLSTHTTMSPDTTLTSHTNMSPDTTLTSHTNMSPDTTLSSHTTISTDTTLSSHTIRFPDTTQSSYTTTSPGTTQSLHFNLFLGTTQSSHTTTSPDTTSSQAITARKDRDLRSDNQDFLDIQRAQFDKLQAALVEMRLSFERSLRQMESRTHSLLWSMSRRLERMTEAMDHKSASSHKTETYLSLGGLLSRGVPAATPSSQPPDSQPMTLHIRGQRRHGGQRRNRS